jgi:hypothetical protein
MRTRLWIVGSVALLSAAVLPARAVATTKGLSQIVTPELQDQGTLSVSAQWQSRQIANPYELQAEAGLTSWLEAAVFQGFSPDEEIFGALARVVQRGSYLLTTGFINWSTRGGGAQPLLEGGYYTEHDKLMGGPILVDEHAQAMAGWAHDFNATWRAQVDWQSGAANWWTLGFTHNVTPQFQYNPAIYFSNSDAHRVVGYVVFTYTFTLWRPGSPR